MKRNFFLICILVNINLLSYCQTPVQVTQPYNFKSYIQAPVFKIGTADTAGTKKTLRDTSALFRSFIDARIKYSDTLTKIATCKLLLDSIAGIRSDLPVTYTLTSNILEADNINRTFKPFSDKQAGLSIYTGSNSPDGTTRANINGYWYATKLYGLFSTPSGYVQLNDASISNTAFFGTKTGTSSIFNKSGTLDVAESNPTVKIERTVSGTGNTTGSLLRIEDNPTTSGTISGSLIEGYVGITKRMDLNPRVPDGPSAVAYVFDTHNTLSNSSAKSFSLRNNNSEKLYILPNGTLRSSYNLEAESAVKVLNGATNYNIMTYEFSRLVVEDTVRIDLNPTVSNVSNSIAYLFDTKYALSAMGTRIAVFKNHGIDKTKIDKDGIIYSNVPLIALYRNTDLTIPVDLNIWAKITGLTTKHNNILVNQGDSVQLTYSGVYMVNMAISSYDGTNVDYEYAIFKNSLLEEPSQILTNTTNTYNVVCSVLIISDGNDWVSFKLRNLTNSNDPTIKKISIIIKPISLSL